MRILRAKSVLLMAAIAGSGTLAVLANSEYASPELDPKHSGSFTSPNEWIDNFSGALNVVDADVTLKGPSGFNMVVTRWYSSKISQWDANTIRRSHEIGPLGVGWQIHQGRLWDNPDSINPIPAYRLELPGGENESFFNNSVL